MRTFIFIVLFSITAAVQAEARIGVVLVDKLLAEAPQVEAINKAMLKEFSGRKDEMDKMQAELKKLEEEYKRNELVMTKDKLEELKSDIIGKLQVFKQKEAEFNRDVNAARNEKLGELQQTIKGVIADIADDEEYDLILSEGVVHVSSKLDITDKVLKKMKKSFK